MSSVKYGKMAEMENSKLRRLLFFLFFLSGLAALVYEVVWARKLSLIFGTTTHAVSSILAVFFTGLALGSYLFGRIVDRIEASSGKRLASREEPFDYAQGKLASSGERLASRDDERLASRGKLNAKPYTLNALSLYGLLELGIGVYAFLTPWIFKLIEGFQVAFWQRFTPTYSGFSLFTFGLSFLGLIIPATFMGGTLPVISKAFSVQPFDSFDFTQDKFAQGKLAFRVGRDVGLLYFVNTAGAVLGAFLAGFLLIATIGVNESILTAAVVNLLIGGIVLAFSGKRLAVREERRLEKKDQETLYAKPYFEQSEKQGSPTEVGGSYPLNPILIAFGLAGFSALSLEVLWTRVLVMVIGGSVYAFTIVLVTFLLGIALGSAIITRFTDRLRNVLIWFAGIEILLGISVILLNPLLGNLPFWFLEVYQSFGDSFGGLQFGLWLMTVGVMIVPTSLMGAAFPVAVRAYSPSTALRVNSERLASRVGAVYAANTVGGIFGSLAAGFIFIPAVGVQKGIWVAGSIYLLVGIGLIFYIIRSFAQIRFKFAYISIIALALLSILIGFYLPSWDKSVLSAGFYKEPFAYLDKEKKEIEQVVSANKILFYKEGLGATISVTKDVYENNLSLRINGKTDASTGEDMENQILLGHLPMFFHPNPKNVLVIGLGSGVTLGSVEQYPVEKIDMVEIEPAVVEAASYFADYNHDALKDKRVNLVMADGRNFLLTLRQAQGKQYDVITSEPSNLWLTGVSNLFTKEFYELAKNHLKDDGIMIQWLHLYAMGENDLKTAVRTFYEVFPEAYAFNVFTSDDMLLVGGKKQIGITSPSDILAYLTMDKGAIEKFSQGAPLHTDNHPILEFSAPKSLYVPTQAGNLRAIMGKWINPLTLISADREFREHFAKMMIAYTESNIGEAIKEGELAREIRNDHPGVNRHLARLYFEKAYYLLKEQKGQEAKKDLLRSLEIEPATQTRIILGSIYVDEGRIDLAQEQFEKAIEASPELPLAHFNLGLVLEQTGDLNRAIEEFERTLELEPDFSRAREELVKLYEMRGDYGKAEEHREAVD